MSNASTMKTKRNSPSDSGQQTKNTIKFIGAIEKYTNEWVPLNRIFFISFRIHSYISFELAIKTIRGARLRILGTKYIGFEVHGGFQSNTFYRMILYCFVWKIYAPFVLPAHSIPVDILPLKCVNSANDANGGSAGNLRVWELMRSGREASTCGQNYKHKMASAIRDNYNNSNNTIHKSHEQNCKNKQPNREGL